MSEAPGGSGPRGRQKPLVSVGQRHRGAAAPAIIAAALGVSVLAGLSLHRANGATVDAGGIRQLATKGAPIGAPPPPAELIAAEAASRATPIAPPQPLPPPVSTDGGEDVANAKAPALVVDLSGAARAVSPGAAAETKSGPSLSGEEQFAERIGAFEPDTAYATQMRNTHTLVPQGTMIPGVLETAINSDLPGFVRGIVSSDVRSFDGSVVVIPRGSRLIGQYKSALALGQSRALVIWTRLITPTGGTIQLASPGTDALGQAGLTGKVDRHFLERFGGAILLSVINAGVSSLGDRSNTQIVIGSTRDAMAIGGGISPTSIPPTIKVAQGAAIRIFAARDLDFANVQGNSP